MANNSELLEKARHHRQKIIHLRRYGSAYNRHVSMVRDAHWQSNDPNFHRFSSWLPPRQLLAAVVVVLLLVTLLLVTLLLITLLLAILWLVDALAIEQRSSRHVRAVLSCFFARTVVTTIITQALLRQPKSCQTRTRYPLDTAITDITRFDTPSTSTEITNLESTREKSAYMTTSAASSAGVWMLVTAVACSCM